MPKESRLEETAEIYQKREELSEKKKFSELDGKGKWQYFKDYYLQRTAIIFALSAAVVYILYLILLAPKKDTILNVAIVNDALPSLGLEKLEAGIGEVLNADPKTQKILIDDSYAGGEANMATQQKLITYLFGGMIDVIVIEEDEIEGYVTDGMMVPVSELLSAEEYAGLDSGGRLLMAAREGDTEEKAYAVYLNAGEWNRKAGGYMNAPVAAVVGSAKFKENASKALQYLAETY